MTVEIESIELESTIREPADFEEEPEHQRGSHDEGPGCPEG